MNDVKTLTKDAFFSTIIVAINLLFYTGIYTISELASLLSITLIVSYFYDKERIRLILSSLSILIIGFLMHNIFTWLMHVMPTVVIANVLILVLKTKKKFLYTILGVLTYFLAEIFFFILEFYYLFDLNFVEFTKYLVEDLGSLAKNLSEPVIYTVFGITLLLVSLFKAILTKQFFVLYHIRIKPHIENR